MNASAAADAAADAVAVLRRWEDSGAVWRVLAESAGQVTVGLCTCDGGEEVSRVTAREEELAAYLAGRSSSLDDVP